MAGEVVLPQDMIEQILVRADVKPLIRFKSVCKSWQSLIRDDRFIKAHLNHSYTNDRNNEKMGHRRIRVTRASIPYREWNLVGSSNGLVCLSTYHGQVLVANPLTRDVKKLPNPKKFEGLKCWGFGYDLSTDDYKVIVDFKSNFSWMSFQVLSLKTNVWKDVGKFKEMHGQGDYYGILCNGKLHWLMEDRNDQQGVILSFDLSEEKFEEISQPRDFKYEHYFRFRLGIIDECLCISHVHHPVWVMKNYNVRESWVSFEDLTHNNDYDAVHILRPIKDSLSHTCPNDDFMMSWTRNVNDDPIFVRSFVSPHVNGKLKRKREA